MNNEINLFARRIQPIDTKRFQILDPNMKTVIEYQQFKKNYFANKQQKKITRSSKTQEKKEKIKVLSQSVDYKQKQGTMTESGILKKSVIQESQNTQVYKITVEGHFSNYALKITRLNMNKVSKEVYFLRQLRHPNIVELKHYYVTYDYENKPSINIILPLMTCNLKQFYLQFNKSAQQVQSDKILKYNIPLNYHVSKKTKKAPIILFKLFLYQVVRGIAYLHSKNITHRDINPRNILVDLESLAVNICDFNSAKIIQQQMVTTNYIGERNYRAPELLLGSKIYDKSVDIWSIGCVIAECFLSSQLFNGLNTVETMADIIKLLGTPTSDDLRNMKSPILDLKMPEIPKFPMDKRFKGDQVDHLVNLLEKILVFNPKNRITAFEILMHPFFNEIKQPNIKINSKSLPNIFNFTRDELDIPQYKQNQQRLIPQWYQEKQKRFEYLKTSMEDAQLILDR